MVEATLLSSATLNPHPFIPCQWSADTSPLLRKIFSCLRLEGEVEVVGKMGFKLAELSLWTFQEMSWTFIPALNGSACVIHGPNFSGQEAS